MKTRTLPLIALLSIGICLTGYSQKSEEAPAGTTPVEATAANSYLDSSVQNRTLVEAYNNGPYFNIPGNPDISRLENVTIGNTTLGAGVSTATGYRLADDFTIADALDVTEMTFYAYQTGSPTANSTITGIFIQIWDGVPGPGSNVIYGNTTTNVMMDSFWSNAYRDSETGAGGTDRPIMAVVADPSGISLAPGQYWVDFVFEGSMSSGPWGPPISILGATTTGDAFQYDPNDDIWNLSVDGGSGFGMGFPFVINGDFVAGVNDNPALRSKISLYPNPAQKDITLSNASNVKLKSATIYTLSGSLVKNIDLSKMNTSQSIDVSSLAAGVYMVKIDSDEGSVVKQLIKN